MTDEVRQLNLERLSRRWMVATMVLALAGVLVFVLAESGTFPLGIDARPFATVLNAVNIVGFLLFLGFRTRIENTIAELVHEADSQHVTTAYHRESQVGLALLLLLVVSGIFFTYLAIFEVDEYYFLIREDGIVENLSALFWFLAAALVLVHVARMARRDPGMPQVIFHVALIVFFIVCGGEEISWGQRITEHETPGWLGAINVQEETTLHNIGSISVFSNGFFLLTLMFFLVVPYLAKRNPQARNVLDLIGFPIANRFQVYIYAGTLAIWIIIGLRFGTLGFHPFSVFEEKYSTQMDDEIFEFFAAYCFVCFSIFLSLRTVTVSRHGAR